MKRDHKQERLVAWIASLAVLIILVAIVVTTAIYTKDPIKKFIDENLPEKEEEVVEEPEEIVEEEEEPQEESFDQDTLDAIFDVEEEKEEAEPEIIEDDGSEYIEEAESILNEMSLEARVAQLFFVRQENITGVDVCTASGDMTKSAIEKYPVGGIVYFSENIEDPEQLSEMINNIQDYSKDVTSLPLFIGIAEEGGEASIFGNNENFEVEKTDSIDALIDEGDIDIAYNAGRVVGKYLKDYGFNVEFSPNLTALDTNRTRTFDITNSYINGLDYEGITHLVDKLVISDQSSGVAKDLAVEAIQNGSDMVFLLDDFEGAYDSVLAAVNDGSITEDRLNSAVTSIIIEKLKMKEDN